MTDNFVKSQGLVLVESAVCAATHEAINKFYAGIPVSLSQAALSGGSHYLSGTVTDSILPTLINMAPAMSSISHNFVQPVVSGGIYALGDMALQIDNRSFLYKLLQQAGSSSVANYASEPIAKLIYSSNSTM